MDPLRTYEYLAAARARLFDWIRTLPDEHYRREFPFGMKRLSATLPHMMLAEWAYARRIERGTRADWAAAPMPRDAEPPFAELEQAWRIQSTVTRKSISDCRAGLTPSGGWDAPHETRTPFEGKVMVVRAAAADIFMQLFCHEIHHRAQAMAMLRMMGVPAQDLDYSLLNYVTWESPAARPTE